MNKLPEKWFIKVEPETRDVLNDWRLQFATEYIRNTCFTCVFNNLYLYSEDVCNYGSYYTHSLEDGYEEITFEQFKRFVLKENNDSWCIRITEQSLPYIKDVIIKRGFKTTLELEDCNYYCFYNYDFICKNLGIRELEGKELTLKEFIDKFSLNYLTKKLEDMEKQFDVLNDEFIVECKTAEETTKVYDWLIKTRDYWTSTYANQSKIKENLIVVCNKKDGNSFYNVLTIVKSKFPNHPVYTFNQFKEMYLNPEIKTNNTQKLVISRTELLEIYNIACVGWKDKIKEDYFSRVDLLSDNVKFEQQEVDEMFNACTESQRPVLVRIFGNLVKFKVGDYVTCNNVSEPTIDKIIEITDRFYRTEACLKDKDLLGYQINNKDLRLATEQEIKRSKIIWENIKTGSVVKLKHSGEICNDDLEHFNFNDGFQVVFYKKPFVIDKQSRFNSQYLAYSSYCTFYQNGKFILYSAHKNVDYITEVISY